MKFFKSLIALFGISIALASTVTAQIGWWGSQDSVNIFTRSRGGVMIGAVSPFAKLTVGGDAQLYNLALVSDLSNLSKNYLKIGVIGQTMEKYQGHILFDLYHSNAQSKYAGFNFRVNGNSMLFINGDGNIGLGTELPEGRLHIKNGPDWNGLNNGIVLNANAAIRFESGNNQYGLVGNNNELNFVLSNPNKGAFDKPFFKILTVQPKKIIIDGDVEVRGRIINSGGFNGGDVVNQGGGAADDVPISNGKNDGVIFNAAIPGEPVTGTDSWIAGANGAIYYNLGHVGIGTSSPQLVSGGSGKFLEIADVSNPGLALRNTAAGGRQYFLYSNAARGSFRIYDASGSSDRFIIDSLGNVGIGTTVPLSKLHVEGSDGNPLITANVASGYGAIGLQAGGVNKLLLGYNGGAGNYGSQTAAGDVSIFANTNLHFAVGTSGNHPSRMTLATSGKIGVGKTNPVYNFDVAGILNADSILVKGVSISGSGNQWVKADSNLYYNAGNVGIGTSSPGAKLDVYTPGAAGAHITADGHILSLRGVNDPLAYSPRLPYIQWVMKDSTRAMYLGWGNTTIGSRYLDLALENGFNLAINGGNVGIGTNQPTDKLEIADGQIALNNLTNHALIKLNGPSNKESGVELKENGNRKWIIYKPANTDELRIKSITDAVTILNSGRVGIGTTTPTAALDINGWLSLGGGAPNAVGGTSGRGIYFPSSANDFQRVYGEHNGIDGSHLVLHQGDNVDDGVIFRNTDYQLGQADYMFISKARMWYSGGYVGIGTTNPTELLTVNGNIRTKKVIVTQQNWADFVFETNYKLRPLADVEQHIRTHKRLPDIPSEKEIKESGLDVGDVQAKLLQKIEELTLYVIEQNKRIQNLEEQLKEKK